MFSAARPLATFAAQEAARMVELIVTSKRQALFWQNVDRRGPDECWPWLRARTRKGYGSTAFYGETCNAHRAAYLFTFGAVEPNRDICHHCDNPPCCNPSHLFVGTRRDNMADKAAKGRSVRGERHRAARLTADQVREMRVRAASGEAYVSLAHFYGIARQNIRSICLRRLWRHVV